MLDPLASYDPRFWTPPCEPQTPARTLGESRIAQALKVRVAAFIQTPSGKRIERALSSVNWDALLLCVVMLSCFMAGMAASAFVILARICR